LNHTKQHWLRKYGFFPHKDNGYYQNILLRDEIKAIFLGFDIISEEIFLTIKIFSFHFITFTFILFVPGIQETE
jgi:hypothetical protein